jgi:hypothetical protein
LSIHKYIHIMFILRFIPENYPAENTILGNNYTITPYMNHQESFMKVYKSYYENLPQAKEESEDSRSFGQVYAFIVSEKTIIPLFIGKGHNYIMTDSGRTFENISFKK